MKGICSLKIQVCTILTFITLAILVIYLILLPYLIISDVISFASTGTSFFFPSLPAVNFLWFLPNEFQVIPLNIGQFLDICVIVITLSQIASSIAVALTRFYKYQPSSADIPVEVKRKFGDSLPNFMRWNILPNGHQFLGQTYDDNLTGQKKFPLEKQDSQWTSFEMNQGHYRERDNGLNRQFLLFSLLKNRSKISRGILGSKHQQRVYPNILASHFEQFVPVQYGCRVNNFLQIFVSSCFSRVLNPNQISEVLTEYVVS
jgi:hypothetical protein